MNKYDEVIRKAFASKDPRLDPFIEMYKEYLGYGEYNEGDEDDEKDEDIAERVICGGYSHSCCEHKDLCKIGGYRCGGYSFCDDDEGYCSDCIGSCRDCKREALELAGIQIILELLDGERRPHQISEHLYLVLMYEIDTHAFNLETYGRN